jgi:3-methyl-2-oxobutanoate hydroxymethyltransferase
MTILDFSSRKAAGRPISMTTCYDASLARLISDTDIDCILVGDSCAMVIHGHEDTLGATPSMMATHTKAVRSGAPKAFIVTDMPFLSVRQGLTRAVRCAGNLLRAGANGVKIEGIAGNEAVVARLTESGIPVMGHLGLTPQLYHSLGGWKIQGRTDTGAAKLRDEALCFERAGAFALVLECVPETLAASIAESLSIPVIGIGAGNAVDGQVLVLQDILGITPRLPSFARPYMEGKDLIHRALSAFDQDVKAKTFPGPAEVFTA